jgi:Cellulase (glycosyl hydrolase family 5)
MKSSLLLIFLLSSLGASETAPSPRLERIVVSRDSHGFETAESHQPFNPWGFNYGNAGRLMEDFWDSDWKTFADDFATMHHLGANVVRLHLQFGKFMDSASQANTHAIEKLRGTLALAEQSQLYLDLTGLACYRKSDVPPWYDGLNEKARWAAQAVFWKAVAECCAQSPAVFCYDLINEPLSPGGKREPRAWYSGTTLGGYDFLQMIALDPAGRKREDIPVEWIKYLSDAIHSKDKSHLITVGSLPWSRKWKYLSGFVPERIAPELDFLSVHIYPDSKLPDEARECLEHFNVGKPVVIEETFGLSCTWPELEEFLLASRKIACGWIGHYDGQSIETADALEKEGKLNLHDAAYREWMRMFVRLKPEFVR